MTAYTLPPETGIGAVHLTVHDLERSEQFYHQVMGFKTLQRHASELQLTADGPKPLLVLHGDAAAPPRPRRTTGLYHYAVLTPSRRDLARSIVRLAQSQYPLQGGADHLVSEALYLADPDDNGIEIYRDRPSEEWPRLEDGSLQMANEPLDINGIVGELGGQNDSGDGLAPGTTIGHMHLNVGNLRDAESFYHELLGFDIVVRWHGQALFVSAGGYHHHLGLNTWNGVGAPPPPENAVGLKYFELALPSAGQVEELADRVVKAGLTVEEAGGSPLLRDPFRNGILLKVL